MEDEIEFREISRNDEPTTKEIARLITKYSWFEGYPIDPYDEVKEAEYIIGAYAGERLVGFAMTTRHASPDQEGNGELWFADTVVLPEFRRRGILKEVYQRAMAYLLTQPGRIFSCTEGALMHDFFLARGWKKIRDTKDESGGACGVYEFPRP